MYVKKNVVVVDDNRSVADVVSMMLGAEGYNVKSYTDPRQALSEISRDRNVNLVITDLQMPEMNGLQLSEKLSEIVPEAEVILLTAYATDTTYLRASDIGVFSVINKPIRSSELVSHVQKGLRSNRAWRSKAVIVNKTDLPKILLIDDYVPLLDMLTEYFKNSGFDVHVATSGKEGIEKGLTDNYHLVLVDIGLPDMSGLEVIRELHNNEPTLALYGFTGEATERERDIAIDSGAREVFCKPMSSEKLAESIDKNELDRQAQIRTEQNWERRKNAWKSLSFSRRFSISIRKIWQKHGKKIAAILVSAFGISLALGILWSYQNSVSQSQNGDRPKNELDKMLEIMERGEKYLKRDEQRELDR